MRNTHRRALALPTQHDSAKIQIAPPARPRGEPCCGPHAARRAAQAYAPRCIDIADLTPLAGLLNLRELDASCSNVSDVTPLAACTNMQMLNVHYTQITDITLLERLTDLFHLQYRPS